MTGRAEHRVIGQIRALLSSGKYKEATAGANALCKQYPEDSECHFLFGVALMQQRKYEKARRVLARAVERFPGDWELRMVLGHVHGYQGDWLRAEETYRKTLEELRRASPKEVAEIHCSIAEALWAQSKRGQALEEWREALKIDPKCKEATKSLRECTNEYGDPKAPHSTFDDLYHFQRIQTERYFRLVLRKEFISKEEAEAVIGVIMVGWNEFVAPRSREMDNWKAKEKAEFLESVALDFKEAVKRWKS